MVQALKFFFAEGADRFVRGDARFDQRGDRVFLKNEFEAMILHKTLAEGSDLSAKNLPLPLGVFPQKRAECFAGIGDDRGVDPKRFDAGGGELEFEVAKNALEDRHQSARPGIFAMGLLSGLS